MTYFKNWFIVAGCVAVLASAGCSKSKQAGEKTGNADDFQRLSERAKSASAGERTVKEKPNRERYDHIVENDFLNAARNPLSTFSVDVDTASYTNIRRLLRRGSLPPAGAVRIEEMVNYFRYNYPQPQSEHPFSVTVDAATCPWNNRNQLVRIGLKGKDLFGSQRPSCNLVFLLDVSGSMSDADKLPLVKSSLRMLVERLYADDRVAIVVYAGAAGLVLPSTPADKKDVILDAMDHLHAGGSTNGGAGIQLAYDVAKKSFIKDGVNRVILCTDGDFNVGTSSDDGLVRLAVEKAKTGVTLSVLGFGSGNLNDSMMNKIVKDANGNYAMIDSLREARKALVEQAQGTLVTIAKDVKVQVDFNPAYVQEYRLIGYEDRMLKAEDFANDKKDAGDIGAGHTVTALYEIVPPGESSRTGKVDPSKYQQIKKAVGKKNNEMLTVRLRYKQPKGTKSAELRVPLKFAARKDFASASPDFRFAASVASFGMILRNSQYKGTADFDFVIKTAESNRGNDKHGYRQEFAGLVRRAKELAGGKTVASRKFSQSSAGLLPK